MAGNPAHSKWDLQNWTTGDKGVTLFEALGIRKGKIQFPKLQTMLTTQAAKSAQTPADKSSNSNAGSGNTPGAATGQVGGTGAVNGCSAAQTAENQKIGRSLAAQYGWGTGTQWDDLNKVVMSESGWCNLAQNPKSTAFGIGQFLNTTWAGTGFSKTTDPRTQIQAMLKYIKQRYGTPSAAWTFHVKNNYY